MKTRLNYRQSIKGRESDHRRRHVYLPAQKYRYQNLHHPQLAATWEDRKKRNRGNEINDPFTEKILSTEHKIIAGHRYLADFLVNDDYQVVPAATEKLV
jgi:hypothetical protein